MARNDISLKKKSYPCNECGIVFSKISHRKTHKKLHAGKEAFNCTQCKDGFNEFRDLRSHLNIHRGHPYKCDLCDKSFMYVWYLNKHAMIHSRDKPHLCHVCNKRFKTGVYLNVHLARHTDEPNFKCSDCSMMFFTKFDLQVHIRSHSEEKSSPSNEKTVSALVEEPCVKAELSNGSQNAKRPQKVFFKNKPLTTVNTKSKNAKEVKKNNSKLRKFTVLAKKPRKRAWKCHKCSKAFYHKQGLLLHVKRCHSLLPEKPPDTNPLETDDSTKNEEQSPVKLDENIGVTIPNQPVEVLSKTIGATNQSPSVEQQNDKDSVAREKVEGSFPCNHCKKPFSNEKGLLVHIKVHCKKNPLANGKKNKHFACDVCHKKFFQKNSLKNHILLHTGEKPFECEVCQKRFTVKGNMFVHMRINHALLPYRFEVCGLRFKQKSEQITHEKSHTNDGQVAISTRTRKRHFHAEKDEEVPNELKKPNIQLRNSTKRDVKLSQQAVVPLKRLKSKLRNHKKKEGSAAVILSGESEEGKSRSTSESEMMSTDTSNTASLTTNPASPMSTAWKPMAAPVVSRPAVWKEETKMHSGKADDPMVLPERSACATENDAKNAVVIENTAREVKNNKDTSGVLGEDISVVENPRTHITRIPVDADLTNHTNVVNKNSTPTRSTCMLATFTSESSVSEKASCKHAQPTSDQMQDNTICENNFMKCDISKSISDSKSVEEKGTNEKEGQCDRLDVERDLKVLMKNQSFPVQREVSNGGKNGLDDVSSKCQPAEWQESNESESTTGTSNEQRSSGGLQNDLMEDCTRYGAENAVQTIKNDGAPM